MKLILWPERTGFCTKYPSKLIGLDVFARLLHWFCRVPHYEQRLRSLHYKKRFQVTLSEIQPRITSVMEASREVSRSRRLRRLLEIVLALGNYMNRGARGNASGFRLASLNRLADTKSSSAKGTTLLHYLVQILEKKVWWSQQLRGQLLIFSSSVQGHLSSGRRSSTRQNIGQSFTWGAQQRHGSASGGTKGRSKGNRVSSKPVSSSQRQVCAGYEGVSSHRHLQAGWSWGSIPRHEGTYY